MNRPSLPLLSVILCTLWLTGCAIPAPVAVPTPGLTVNTDSTGEDRVPIRLLLLVDQYDLSQRSPGGMTADQAVVADFNASQNRIELILENPSGGILETLTEGFAVGDAPDIVGAMSLSQAAMFPGQWLDLSPLIQETGYDLTQFPEALVNLYQTPDGQTGLPFTVSPSVIFYNSKLFDQAGLQYPPPRYGDTYTMPDGTQVNWDWNSVREIAKRLTLDADGRNATAAGFNRDQIVQYGYTWQFEIHPNVWGSFWSEGTLLAPGGSPGQYHAQVPDAWEAAWTWTYEGLWGSQPFIGDATSARNYLGPYYGNPFNSGLVAMTAQPIWLTCCLDHVTSWDLAALPSYEGKTNQRLEEGAFRIWEGTSHPKEAFAALAYLLDEGARRLIFGDVETPAPYDKVPARIADQSEWRQAQKERFPEVRNWELVTESLTDPDTLTADVYLPNHSEAWALGNAYALRWCTFDGLDLDAEIENYANELTIIFNR